MIAAADAEPVVVAGNHDAMLSSVIDVPLHDEIDLGDTVVCHGHEPPAATGERYVIGHEHPALQVEGVKRPCYVVGTDVYRGGSLVVLPAFSPLLRGTAFNHQTAADCHSPVLQSVPLRACRPVIRDEDGAETLTFPPLGRMAAFL